MRLMVTLSEGGNDETPLQVKLNGVATVIGKNGLVFAVLTFLVLTVRYLTVKAFNGETASWSMRVVVSLLNFAFSILVVAVMGGFSIGGNVELGFWDEEGDDDRALIRHMSVCETMGSATCICMDKTVTLTTNHMVVINVWMCGDERNVEAKRPENVSLVRK